MSRKDKILVVGQSLSKKVWVSIHPAVRKAELEEGLDAFFFRNPDLYDAQVNMGIQDSVQECTDLAMSTVLHVREFKVSKDRSFPRTDIYVPCFLVDEHFVSSVDEIDRHEPRIRILLTVSEEDIGRARIGDRIDHVVSLLADRRVDHRILFIIEDDILALKAMLSTIEEISSCRRSTPTESGAFPTILEISPHAVMSEVQDTVELLLRFFSVNPEMLHSATEGPCGLVSLLFRIKALCSLGRGAGGSSVTPVLSCASGLPPRWGLAGPRSIVSHCFYAPIHLFPQRVVNSIVGNRCASCDSVDCCGTCSVSLMLSGSCNIYPLVKVLVERFSSDPKLLEALTPTKPLAGILALDWDYIFEY